MFFGVCLHLLEIGASLVKGGSYIYLCILGQDLEYCKELCRTRKVEVVDPVLRLMTLLALESWLDF